MSYACNCIYMVAGRKAHLCAECHQQIAKGEQHEVFSGLMEGHWHTYRTCQDCISARKAFFRFGCYFTFVWEEIEEHLRFADITVCCLEKLTPAARAKVIELIDEVLEDQE